MKQAAPRLEKTAFNQMIEEQNTCHDSVLWAKRGLPILVLLNEISEVLISEFLFFFLGI
jgi:hypothetical protein